MRKIISAIVAVLCFIKAMGIAGDYDIGSISFTSALIQLGICIAVAEISMKTGGLIE